MAKGGAGVLSVDGKQVDSKTIPHTIPALMTIDETFDVGIDTRTGVDDSDYQSPFKFNGKILKLTVKLEEPQRTAAAGNRGEKWAVEEEARGVLNSTLNRKESLLIGAGLCDNAAEVFIGAPRLGAAVRRRRAFLVT